MSYQGNTSRYSRDGKLRDRIMLQDLINTYECTADPELKRRMGQMFAKCGRAAFGYARSADSAGLWIDASYSEETGKAGIGVVIKDRQNGVSRAFGKPIRAKSSQDAEIMAMAVGISYLLDTFPDTKSVIIKYDCSGTTAAMAGIRSLSKLGSPYTNLSSAIDRLSKSGVGAVFSHVKGHSGDYNNAACDLIARYYSGAELSPYDLRKVGKALDTNRKGRGNNGGEPDRAN